jgi:YfiH family protein
MTAPVALAHAALTELSAVRHGFFTRAGGVSEGIFASLNCGPGSGDDPAHVAANRARALAALGLDGATLLTAHQIHSATALTVDAAFAPEARPRTDGLVTRRPGLALGVLSADCAPLLFADPEAGVIGAAHAGWRGALAGVAEATLEAMTRAGARKAAIHAAIGPCIGRESYEVGSEFPAPFLAADAESRDFFRPAARAGHFMFDLPGYLERRLSRLELASVGRLARDTCAEPEHFFSYRRTTHEGGRDYGRGLSLIALT